MLGQWLTLQKLAWDERRQSVLSFLKPKQAFLYFKTKPYLSWWSKKLAMVHEALSLPPVVPSSPLMLSLPKCKRKISIFFFNLSIKQNCRASSRLLFQTVDSLQWWAQTPWGKQEMRIYCQGFKLLFAPYSNVDSKGLQWKQEQSKVLNPEPENTRHSPATYS